MSLSLDVTDYVHDVFVVSDKTKVHKRYSC